MKYAPQPGSDEYAALEHYAQEFGRFWKSALRLDWHNARLSYHRDFPNRGSILHGLRNHPGFGPEGLEKFQFQKMYEVRHHGQVIDYVGAATLAEARRVFGRAHAVDPNEYEFAAAHKVEQPGA